MIKAILFDLDETIILDEQISLKAFGEAAKLASDLPGVDLVRLAADAGAAAKRLWQEGPYNDYCTRIGHSAWEGLWAGYDKGDHPTLRSLGEWVPGFRVATWQEALKAQGTSDEALAEAMAQRFIEVRREFPRYPEIDALLADLGARYKLGIVTNGVPGLQREKLAGSGVEHLFDAVVISGEIDIGKPDPGIFGHICQELGVEPSQCVMVGDNPERDVAGAINAGCLSVWVQRNQRPKDPRYPADLECTDLSAMRGWLERL